MALVRERPAAPNPPPQELRRSVARRIRMGLGELGLHFVSYDHPGQRERLLADLREDLQDLTIATVSLQDLRLDLRNHTSALFDTLLTLARDSTGEKPADVVLLLDWEQRLNLTDLEAGQPESSLLRTFNLGRIFLEERFPCPVVVLLPRAAMEILRSAAKDLVSWRTGDVYVPLDPEAFRTELAEALEHAVATRSGPAAAALERALLGVETLPEGHAPPRLVADAFACLFRLRSRAAAAGPTDQAAVQTAAERLLGWTDRHRVRSVRLWEARHRAVRILETAAAEATQFAPPWEALRGARALQSGDSLVGREDEHQDLLRWMAPPFRWGVLWGETGCGKSSLVHAALVPSLWKWDVLPVAVTRYQPGEQLEAGLWESIRGAIREAGCEPPEAAPPTLPEMVRAALQTTGRAEVVLVLDQFERVFSAPVSTRRKERRPFLRRLAECADDLTLPLRILFVLRADRLFRVAEIDRALGSGHEPLQDPLARKFRKELGWLREGDALRVLESIEKAAGVKWEPALRNRVARDLAGEGEIRPVELQIAAAGLVLGNIATVTQYQQRGGPRALPGLYLDAAYRWAGPAERVRRIGRTLVSPGVPHMRMVRPVADIAGAVREPAPAVRETLGRLQQANLVTETPRGEYELVHDFLADPVWEAGSPHALDVAVVREAGESRRRLLPLRVLRAVRETVLQDLPPALQRRIVALHRQTVAYLVAATLTAGALVPALFQWSFVHFDVEGEGAHAVVVRSGFPELYGYALPGWRQRREDTGLTEADLLSREAVEALRIPFWRGNDPEQWQPLIARLKPAVRARWECSTGNWEAGLAQLEKLPDAEQPVVWSELGWIESERITRRLLERLAAGKGEPDYVVRALGDLAARLSPEQADQVAAPLLARLAAGKGDPDVVVRALGDLAARRSPEQADQVATPLLSRLAAGNGNPNHVVLALRDLAPRLSSEQADRVAAQLLARLDAGEGDPDYVLHALSALAARLSPEQADRHAAPLLARLAAGKGDPDYVLQALGALAPQLSPAQADRVAAPLLARLTAGKGEPAYVLHALGALAARLSPEQAGRVVEGIATAWDRQFLRWNEPKQGSGRSSADSYRNAAAAILSVSRAQQPGAIDPLIAKLRSPAAERSGRYRDLVVEGLAEWWMRTEVTELMHDVYGPPDPRQVQAHAKLERALADLRNDARAPVWRRIAAFQVPIRAAYRAEQRTSERSRR